jgi:hypothetical protein
MKKLAVVGFTLLILIGVFFYASPFLASWYLGQGRTAQETQGKPVIEALQRWFYAPGAPISDAHAYTFTRGRPPVDYFLFRFNAPEQPLARFVRMHDLHEQPLTPESMQTVFKAWPAPDWWTPEQSPNKYYYTGQSEGKQYNLIYTPASGVGYLLIVRG